MDDNDNKIMLYCSYCNSMVESEIISCYTYDRIAIHEQHIAETIIYLSKCLRCYKPFVLQETYNDIEGETYNSGKLQIYPNKENEFIKNTPPIIQSPYFEALKCFHAGAFEACVIMCRKGIDAICDDKGEIKGNLAQKLKRLKDNGLLEETFYNWANELRDIGNAGAHSHLKQIEQQDAKDTLEFFEALITYLYHLVNQYNQLRSRRLKK